VKIGDWNFASGTLSTMRLSESSNRLAAAKPALLKCFEFQCCIAITHSYPLDAARHPIVRLAWQLDPVSKGGVAFPIKAPCAPHNAP